MPEIDVSKSRLFQDLIIYTKLPPELVWQRCNYAIFELAVQWHRKKDIEDYYKNAELYLYDLTKYQLRLEHLKLIGQIIIQLKGLSALRILEYGGGIGEFSIKCSENNLEVTYFDLDGVIKNYAIWRFARHKSSKVKVAQADPLDNQWDAINIMDVLEHLEHPEEVIIKLRKNAKYIFCNPNNVKYNVYYPQHISKYDITEDFEYVKGYLWKNKRIQ
jgi:SAM-dependent methyltransferase